MRTRLLVSLAALALAPIAAGQVPLYLVRGSASGDAVGASVAAAGDVDGDGVVDYAIGAPGSDWAAPQGGRASVYSGASGLLLYAAGGTLTERLGQSIAAAGDVDMNGSADVIAGGPFYSSGGAIGRVQVYGGPTGALLRELYGTGSSRFGTGVAGIGDVDLDGHDDLLVGAPGDDTTGADRGSATVFAGADGSVIRVHYGVDTFDELGVSVASAGDVDMDGVPDYAAGALNGGSESNGSVYVYSGATGAVLHTVVGNSPFDQCCVVAGVGDIDQDGHADFAVGAHRDDQAFNDGGSVYVFAGASGALLHHWTGESATAAFGFAVAAAGDHDGDGVPDVAVGAWHTDAGGFVDNGRVYVLSGASGGVLESISGGSMQEEVGCSVAGLGDLNGDGRADLAYGAPQGLATTLAGPGYARVLLSGWTPPSEYCVAKTNSLACTPAIQFGGAPSLSVGDNFVVEVANVLNQQNGLLFWGAAADQIPFGGGVLCVAPPLVRTDPQSSGGSAPPANDCSGQYTFHFSHAYMAGSGWQPGHTLYAQFWSRDPGFPPPYDYGLSSAVAIPVVP
jgi:hypothetical protein